MSNVKVELFPTVKPFKNRRFSPYERQVEKLAAKAFCRPERTFFYDPPIYPWLPPEPVVNFDLNYKYKAN